MAKLIPPVGQKVTCGNGPPIDLSIAVPPAASAGKNFKNLNPWLANFITSLGVAAPGKNGISVSLASAKSSSFTPGLTIKSAPAATDASKLALSTTVPVPT